MLSIFILFFYILIDNRQECESSLKHKSELLTKLESQKETMGNAIVQLEKKYVVIWFVIKHQTEKNETKKINTNCLFKFMRITYCLKEEKNSSNSNVDCKVKKGPTENVHHRKSIKIGWFRCCHLIFQSYARKCLIIRLGASGEQRNWPLFTIFRMV